MDVLFLLRLLRWYPGLRFSSEHKNDRKNLFPSACFCWDARLSVPEMNQKRMFDGTIGYRDLYLEFLFCHFKVFRLHAILHDAVEAVRAHSGKSPGRCNMVARGPNSCLLGHVSRLLFCLYVKHFPLSIFNSVHFQSSMSCIVLDIELADTNVAEELGNFFDGKFRDTLFVLQKSRNPKNMLFDVPKP